MMASRLHEETSSEEESEEEPFVLWVDSESEEEDDDDWKPFSFKSPEVIKNIEADLMMDMEREKEKGKNRKKHDFSYNLKNFKVKEVGRKSMNKMLEDLTEMNVELKKENAELKEENQRLRRAARRPPNNTVRQCYVDLRARYKVLMLEKQNLRKAWKKALKEGGSAPVVHSCHNAPNPRQSKVRSKHITTTNSINNKKQQVKESESQSLLPKVEFIGLIL
jgi:hypothetical protein